MLAAAQFAGFRSGTPRRPSFRKKVRTGMHFETKLPTKSTGGLFIPKKMEALALIKVDEIYAVSCYRAQVRQRVGATR